MGYLGYLIFVYLAIGTIPVPGAAIPSFDLYLSGGNCGKSDLSTDTGVTNTTCANKCIKTNTCRGYSFHEFSRTPGRGRCKLMDHVCLREIENANINTYTMRTPEGMFAEMEVLFDAGYDCPGNDIETRTDHDADACSTLCLGESDCQGFVVSTDNVCTLKSKVCVRPVPDDLIAAVYQKKYIPDGYRRNPAVTRIDPSDGSRITGSSLMYRLRFVSSRQVTSMAECKNICDASTSCTLFEYITLFSEDSSTGDNCWYGGTPYVVPTVSTDRPHVVYEKLDKPHLLRSSKGKESIVRRHFNAVAHGFDCPGNTLSIKRKEDIHNCARTCIKHEKCVAFVWDESVQLNSSIPNCWRKSACETRVANPGHSIWKKR